MFRFPGGNSGKRVTRTPLLVWLRGSVWTVPVLLTAPSWVKFLNFLFQKTCIQKMCDNIYNTEFVLRFYPPPVCSVVRVMLFPDC